MTYYHWRFSALPTFCVTPSPFQSLRIINVHSSTFRPAPCPRLLLHRRPRQRLGAAALGEVELCRARVGAFRP
jgi:hypothetical protein